MNLPIAPYPYQYLVFSLFCILVCLCSTTIVFLEHFLIPKKIKLMSTIIKKQLFRVFSFWIAIFLKVLWLYRTQFISSLFLMLLYFNKQLFLVLCPCYTLAEFVPNFAEFFMNRSGFYRIAILRSFGLWNYIRALEITCY